MSLKICSLALLLLSKPFGLELRALFLERGQQRQDLCQKLDLLLVFKILVVRVSLTCLHLLESGGLLLEGKGLKPVRVASKLVRRRWLIVDVLSNLIIFDTKLE